MLELHDIRKEYSSGEDAVHALRGVSVAFRPHEFVAILGPSGCGKTTLLNIVGGLDHYTSGDLVIDGVSTKQYRDHDWDVYRNHRIGFVFQSYNLIPHQTVLANVELALTLSGVSKQERRERAIRALEKVGLGDQLKKKPTQMSGGQMQRVAIARALVNDPQIVLADEPTGALDTQTSEQIMEILKEISKDKLIIMVTHNPDLADTYATRTIRILDGEIISDSDPYLPEAAPVAEAVEETRPEPPLSKEAKKEKKKEKKERGKKKEKTSMSFLTALSLSLNNLMTKKARTVLTSFAGSIGIIGIALILALSNGIQVFIDKVQEDTLSSYPLSIQQNTMDLNALLSSIAGNSEKPENLEPGYIYPNNQMSGTAAGIMGAIKENNLADFKNYLDSNEEVAEYATIQYKYGITPMVWTMKDGEPLAVNPSKAYETLMMFTGTSMQMDVFSELLDNQTLLESQFELIDGNWPTAYNEVVLIVDENYRISDLALYALGLRDQKELEQILMGETVDLQEDEKYSFETLTNIPLTLLLTPDIYQLVDPNDIHKGCTSIKNNPTALKEVLEDEEKAIPLKISGIIRRSPDAAAVSASGIVGYLPSLTSYIIEKTKDSDLAKLQSENPTLDIFTGKYFLDPDKAPSVKKNELIAYLALKKENTAAAAQWYIENYPALQTLVNIGIETGKVMAEFPDGDNAVKQLQEAIKTELYANKALFVQLAKDYFDQDFTTATDEQIKLYVGLFANFCTDYDFAVQTLATIRANSEEYATAIGMKVAALAATAAESPETVVAEMDAFVTAAPDEIVAVFWDGINPDVSTSTLEINERWLNIVDINKPTQINIYPKSFHAKEEITRLIEEYNADKPDEKKLSYTDYIGVMLDSVSIILDVITYVLVGFVAISLVVSSIMIGIITYISVLERTKEIGILRAIGASKRDVSRVFLAESMIVGFAAGTLGILVTLVLCLPINLIIQYLSGFNNIGAELPFLGGVILVLISVLLTFVAGVLPARIAAKKEPVEALRSE